MASSAQLRASLPQRSNGDPNRNVLGRAASTQAGKVTAMKFFNGVLKKLGYKQFEDLTPVDVDNDNLEEMLWQVGTYACTYPTFDRFDKDLNPPSPESTKILAAATVYGYVSQGIIACREKFPNHPAFPSNPNDKPQWETELKAGFFPQFERNKLLYWNNGDYTSGTTASVSLYRYSVPLTKFDPDAADEMVRWYGERELNGSGAVPTSHVGVCLHSIVSVLIGEATPLNPSSFVDIDLVNKTHNLVNRGAEAKFYRWSEVTYHHHYECFSISKHQQKTLIGNTQAIVANPRNPLLCPLFTMGLNIFPGEGLRRSAYENENNLVGYMYPALHAVSSSSVCRQIGTVLKRGLGSNVSSSVKEGVSVKSLRSGAITELALHPRVGLLEVCARSGHKTGTNVDSYFDTTKLERSMVGAKILSENPCMSTHVVVPKPHWLNPKCKGPFEALHRVTMAGNCVDEFESRGKLYYPSQILLCIQIMWFNYIKDNYGHIPLIVYWIDCAKQAKIYDPEEPELEASLVLEKWSLCLLKRFEATNDLPKDCHVNNVTDLMEMTAATSRQTRQVAKEQLRIRNEFIENFQQVANAVNELIKEQRAQRSILMSTLSSPSNTHPNSFTTPDTQKKRKADTPVSSNSVQYLRTEASAADRSSPVFNQTNHYHVSASNLHVSGPSVGNRSERASFGALTVAPVPVHPLSFSTVSSGKKQRTYERQMRQAPRDVPDKANVLVSVMLEQLHQSGHFKRMPYLRLQEGVPACCTKEANKFHYTMELLDLAFDEHDRKELRRDHGEITGRERCELYERLANKADNKLRRVEGSVDPEQDKKNEKKIGGKKKKLTVCAVGRRVKDCKNAIRKVKGITQYKGRYDDTPLQEPWEIEELRPKGTPVGNSSIIAFFGKGKKPVENCGEQLDVHIEMETAEL